MRNPCFKAGHDCTRRHLGCRKYCKAWKEFEAYKQEEYAQRTIAWKGQKNFESYTRKAQLRRWAESYRKRKKEKG